MTGPTPPTSLLRSLATPYQLAFLLAVFVQAIAVLALIIILTVRYDSALVREPAPLRAIVVYLVLFITSQIFEMIVSIDALRTRNVGALIGTVAFNCSLLIYASILPRQLSDALETDNCRDTICPPGGPDRLFAQFRGLTIAIPCVPIS